MQGSVWRDQNARGAASLTDYYYSQLLSKSKLCPRRQAAAPGPRLCCLNWLPNQARTELASTGDGTLLTGAEPSYHFQLSKLVCLTSSAASSCCFVFVAECRVSRRTRVFCLSSLCLLWLILVADPSGSLAPVSITESPLAGAGSGACAGVVVFALARSAHF